MILCYSSNVHPLVGIVLAYKHYREAGPNRNYQWFGITTCRREGSKVIPGLWAWVAKRWWCQQGRVEGGTGNEEEDKSKALFCTQLHVLCLLHIYMEFGWTSWSTGERSGFKMAVSSHLGLKWDKAQGQTWGPLMGCVCAQGINDYILPLGCRIKCACYDFSN